MSRPLRTRHLVLAGALSALLPAASPSEVSGSAELRLHAGARTRQDPSPIEHAARLRAMIVFKIAPYLSRSDAPETEDETEATTPYRIAVAGTDPTAKAIAHLLRGKHVDGRKVVVTAVDVGTVTEKRTEPPFDLLYIAQSVDAAQLARIVDQHRKTPTALVCERPAFAANGGGVQLFVKDEGLRFEVNGEALRGQGLRASPQLLKLSKRGPRR